MNSYAVKYYGGSGGHFIQELIIRCETQDTTAGSYTEGHAHYSWGTWARANIDHAEKSPDQHRLKASSSHDFIVTHGGEFHNMMAMYRRDPEHFRMVNLVIDSPLEMALCEYNHFYKNQRIEFKVNPTDYGLFPHYKNLVSSRYASRDDITMPDWETVSTEDMAHILIERTLEHYRTDSIMGIRGSRRYNELKKIPHRELTVTEVMEDSQTVLETISALVGKPITNTMRTNCERYMQAQQTLRNNFPAYELIKQSYPTWNPLRD